jgi:hypothetical protein
VLLAGVVVMNVAVGEGNERYPNWSVARTLRV